MSSKHLSEIRNATDEALVNMWNLAAWSRKLGNVAHYESEVGKEMDRRGIPHKVGKRTIAATRKGQ